MIALYIVKQSYGWDPESELTVTTSWSDVIATLSAETAAVACDWHSVWVDRYEIADNGMVFESRNDCTWEHFETKANGHKRYRPTPGEWS